MMRGVSHWAVAVRKPPPEEVSDDGTRPRRGPTARSRSPRHRSAWHRCALRRALVESLHRFPGARDLRQRAARRRGGGDLGRHVVGTVVISLVFAIGLFFVLPVGLTSLWKDQLNSTSCSGRRQGDRAHLDLPRLPAGDLAPARPAARVRVPRRRAQDDLLLRGRPPAHARERASASRRLHPRCGTSFLLIVMIVAIFVFAPIGRPAWYWLFPLAHRSASRWSPASPSR